MPSSRWPTQNELKNIVGGSSFHDVKSGHLKKTFTGVLCIFIMVSDFVTFRGFLWAPICVSASVCVSCAFSCLVVLSYSGLFDFALSYFIIP